MAKWAATLAAVAAILMGAAGMVRGDTPVVLHVTSYERIPQGELAAAQRDVIDTYRKIGVRTVWTDGVAADAEPDGALHLDVIFVTEEMAARKQPNPAAFGEAARQTRKAYIYYGRIRAHSVETRCDPGRVLGFVLAHELGHLLLPEYSHAPAGLMAAERAGRIFVVPDFLPQQAATIRAMLSEQR
jgi:hypothetical protein